jgi:hypothetical protein
MPDAPDPLGRAFAEAVGAKDFDRMAALMHPDIDFRAMTPGRVWEAPDAERVLSDVFRRWWEDDDIDELLSVETDAFADIEHVSYRYRGRSEDEPFIAEQQAYYRVRNGQIEWMRIMCSGTRQSGPQAHSVIGALP